MIWMENFWDYSVWGGLNLFSVLLISLLAANLMKKFFPVKEKYWCIVITCLHNFINIALTTQETYNLSRC